MVGRMIAMAAGVSAAALVSGCIIVAKGSDWPRPPRLSAAEAESVPEIPAGGVPTIREKYASEFARLAPGMSVADFKEVFPDAMFVEQRAENGTATDAYSVTLRQRYRYRWDGDYYAWMQTEEVWFYFRDGKFLKWGEARQWR